MGLMTSYLIKTSNAEEFFNAIRNAQAPERFTQALLKDLEFATSNDRLYIPVLKGLRFLDDSGVPTERYFAFLDQSQSGRVLAEALKESYSDLFAVNVKANELELEDIKGKFKTLTRGSKTEDVIGWMANTFKTLCDLADWSPLDKPPETANETPATPAAPDPQTIDAQTPGTSWGVPMTNKPMELHYNIQLILPESRDPAVYDALFTSLRRHIL